MVFLSTRFSEIRGYDVSCTSTSYSGEPSFYESIRKLIGHVIGGSILFASIAALSWLIGFGVERLHVIHPFNPAVLSLLHGFEVALLYLDFGLSGMVLLFGAYRFVREITGE